MCVVGEGVQTRMRFMDGEMCTMLGVKVMFGYVALATEAESAPMGCLGHSENSERSYLSKTTFPFC